MQRNCKKGERIITRTARVMVCFALVYTSSLKAQNQTVGLFVNSEDSFNGYTLVSVNAAHTSHLIDNCGRVVNEWHSNYRTGESSYLLEDGSLLRTARLSSNTFNGGGIGGRVERFSWEGDLVWSFEYASAQAHLHHDIAWMPNGNILMLAWERKVENETQAAGRLGSQELWPPHILEIEPTGTEGGNVVWEWHAWDHLIQDADPTKPNFGVPSENPQRFDVNFGSPSSGGPPGSNGGDWFHCNAVTYNPDLDQIMFNSRKWSEFYIIDHSIGTEEASGPAGDVMFRWGNPVTYGQGTELDQELFGQHDSHWLINEGPVHGENPLASVLIFNNGLNRLVGSGSSIDELTLPLQSDGTYAWDGDVPAGPNELDWRYPETLPSSFYSSYISGSQRLPNGNTLICNGADGHIFEVNDSEEVVWDYVSAMSQFGPIDQGSTNLENATFRAYRYAPDYPGLQGRDLTPGEPVESNPFALVCEIYSEPVGMAAEYAGDQELIAYPNPVIESLQFEVSQPSVIRILNMQGQLIHTFEADGRMIWDASGLMPGPYLIQATSLNSQISTAFQKFMKR